MSKARHKKAHKALGGSVYSGAGSNVIKEANEKKHGGAVKEMKMMEEGAKKGRHRMDKRPRRAHGGRVGSDKSPFSSAARPAQNTEAAKP